MPRYLPDYEFVTVENLMTSDLVSESRSRASNEAYHVVLFIEKSPTPGTHARSLLIRQEPANTGVQPVKLIPVTLNGDITSSLSSASYCS